VCASADVCAAAVSVGVQSLGVSASIVQCYLPPCSRSDSQIHGSPPLDMECTGRAFLCVELMRNTLQSTACRHECFCIQHLRPPPQDSDEVLTWAEFI